MKVIQVALYRPLYEVNETSFNESRELVAKLDIPSGLAIYFLCFSHVYNKCIGEFSRDVIVYILLQWHRSYLTEFSSYCAMK